MAQQTINIGAAPDDGTGDTLRVGGDKINDNFTELYTDKADKAGGTFTGDIIVPDEAYDATAWNGSLEVPTKNAVRDKIESLGGGAIEVLDEGGSLTAALTSIDFVGAGVTASNSGGDVTVTIAGGGGYNAENARDDIGAALVEGAGIDITVNDGSDTITITALTYEAGPPTPPTTADLATWDNQGTSTATDGTGAMILKPQVDGGLHGRYKAAPGTPYDVYCRVELLILSTGAITTGPLAIAGILFKDTGGDNERLAFGFQMERVAGDEQNLYQVSIQRWSGASPPVFSAVPVSKYNLHPVKWLRVNNDGTTLTFYVSPDGKNWISVGTETLAAYIDGAASYGVFAAANAAATECAAFFSYFSTTAPS